jgi:hypothetical protein
MLVHGVDSPLAYLREAAPYTAEGRVADIRCPALICNADDDDIGATGSALYGALKQPKRYHKFLAAEGAGAHCESGGRAVFNRVAFDWLDEVLGRPRSTENGGPR